MQKHKEPLSEQGLCVLESTGGYEMELLTALCDQAHTVHRADGYQVKHFIRSYRKQAKTDKLDAQALALYGYERHVTLACYQPSSDKQLMLCEFATRRRELTTLLVAEKNRLQAPKTRWTKDSCQTLIQTIESELRQIESEMEQIINQDETLKAKQKALKSIPGIGEIIGGSQREERLDVLKEKMAALDIDEKELWWYLDLRKYGTAVHSGFGFGFERLVMFATGMTNIRDVIPYPRTPHNEEF